VQNGVYSGGITLQAGQRLLGDGIVHLITARQGTFTLPILQPGATPTITDFNQHVGGMYVRVPAAIVMAANTEVSGFYFAQPPPSISGGLQIFASGITGAINVNRNAITFNIDLSNIAGPMTLTNNFATTPDGLGAVYLTNITGPVIFSHNTINTTFNTRVTNLSGPLTYTNNTITFFGPSDTLSLNGANSTWNVANNVFTGPTGGFIGTPAVRIFSRSGTLSLNLIGNTSNTGFGLSRLQFFASGNSGPILNDGTAKQVSTPFP
jgi:hypothetical protein